ncbi:MAG: LysR family transcriptional regulator [Burkholderiales bacterium]|nr:LysR family transcriptional regulator [Burkholderiales bacterium]MDE2455996.1 LysR family transcriptional regulator [Burkholderiales bacterium]
MNTARQRALSVGPLRAFEAVARRLSFRGAAEEMHLTQPAISRQIRALEDELGATLFLRGTRHVELTGAGETLLRSVAPLLDRMDATVRQIRSSQARRKIGVTTFASFASLWLLPRLRDFQRANPGIDIRISAVDGFVEPDDPELDIALRYCHPDEVPPGSTPLFSEVLTPAAGPSLRGLGAVADLARHTLLEDDDYRPSSEYLSWRHWLQLKAPPGLEPHGWIYLNFTHQLIQAALAGQGVALARVALVSEQLERGELVEPFGAAGRVTSPYGYWLVRWPGRRERPELAAFEAWLIEQAAATRRIVDAQAAEMKPPPR